MSRFKDYNFKKEIQAFIEDNGFESPTEIQQKIIPSILKGKDVIAISSTGTGKTHAFLIPILEKIDFSKTEIQAIIISPTRELALQIGKFLNLAKKQLPQLKVKVETGGQEKKEIQQQPHILIGTPTRIKKMFLDDVTFLVNTAKIVVVDETDMIFDYGFLPDLDLIISKLTITPQMLVFSATINDELQRFLSKYLSEPFKIDLTIDSQLKNITHYLVPVKHSSYQKKLLSVLNSFQPFICLIFANTKLEVKDIASYLRENGYKVLEIHGDLKPRERKQALTALVNQEYKYVVASDVAARGLDVEGITHVISLGLPQELEFYFHRSGRTGRSHHEGYCFLLYKSFEQNRIQQLSRQGIDFIHQDYKNEEWVILKPLASQRKFNGVEDKEIAKVLYRKNTKVKPGYKKKRQAEINKIKRKKRRELIQENIKQEKKKRAIKRQNTLK